MFSGESASGNPCGVLELDSWLSDEELQEITCKAGLPVTSFVMKDNGKFHIRWFSMDGEINLCGHGSLGAGAAIISKYKLDSVLFSSKYGNLSIAKKSGVYTLELPSWKGETCAVPSEISDLTVDAIEAFSTRDLVLVLPSIESVRSFKPDDMRFKQLSNYHALIVTAANGENGYVLRYFAPKIGISEDLATGSAQCSLSPYWFEKLNSDSLQVHQLSSSGGYFGVRRISDDSIVLLANATLREIEI
ncbi:isomerase [Photobacterium angustum]|uniref:PhzF family phenazine biosynthesis protein n=1 Tax=Photobacterium angustum TaxID=661 RepID=A0ABX5H995_PHOAN|nr:PhzF family phenazine biosynthesis protein [Photobacterium angustum]KJG35348.1 isomerase [Photobacterium angustum]PSX12259.1 PhzF family phenazine biosynthesis protein [Photobacterium angustum]